MSHELVPESLADALVECVKAAGGSKVVGARLFPEKMVDAAQRHLLNCLKDGRAERLTPDQALLVFRLAREKGCHVGMRYMASALGYAEPVPVDPRDESAELQRQFIEAAHLMQGISRRIEELQPQLLRQTLKAA